jgi:hypothetical protein
VSHICDGTHYRTDQIFYSEYFRVPFCILHTLCPLLREQWIYINKCANTLFLRWKNKNRKKSECVLGIKHYFPRSKYRIVSAPNAPFGKKSLSPSNSIVGHFQKLKGIRHPHLCQYIDLIKGKHGFVFRSPVPSLSLPSVCF